MKKLATSLGILVLIAGAAAAAVPWYVGMQTEDYFRGQLTQALVGPNSSLTITVKSYERGWLTATAVQRVALKADPGVYFDVQHEINHVSDPRVGWVTVRSTPKWPKEVQAGADYYFGGKPALTLDSLYNFDGQLTTTLQSPAFSKPMLKSPQTTLTWGGAQGSLQFGQGGQVQVSLQAPSVGLAGGGASAQLTSARLEGKWVVAGAEIDWHGDTKLSIGQMLFSGPFGKGSLNNLQAAVSQRNQGETIQVGYSLKVGKGEAAAMGQQAQSFTNAVLELELDQLDKGAVRKYVDDLHSAQKASASEDAYNRLALQLSMSLMNDLLKGSPVLRVKKIGVETPNGLVTGSATLGFDGKDMQPGGVATEWMQRISFTGSAEISRTLLKSWMAQQAQAQAAVAISQQPGAAAPDPAQLQQIVDRLLEDQFKAWGAAGIVQDKGDRFMIQAEFTKGKLTVNGLAGDHFMPPMFAANPGQPIAPPVPAAPRKPDQAT